VVILALVTLPALVFGIPAALGHPVIPGDDLTQNFPLRALVGSDLRHGHLPLLDPYIWSGAPLLGGWNAGAAYPFTWLFAVLPGSGAWAVNQIVVAATAGVGTYVFLRASALRPVPGALGAVTFGFAGAMVAQTPHFGLLAGMSWTPWMLLALLRLSQPGTVSRRGRWVLVLGGSVTLCVLAGEPRAVDDAAAIAFLYALWRTTRLGRDGVRYLGSVAAGGLVGVGLSAVQWAPGLAAIATSQRGAHSMVLFSSGSLPVRWLALLLVPDLIGGSGSFGQPMFLATYNLTEVTGYVGLLPLVAAVALPFQAGRRARAARAARAAWAEPGGAGRRWRALPEWLVWEVAVVVGLVLALGGNTPVGTLLYHLPLFGSQRLQSRNILVTDFALAMLLAYWVEGWIGEPRSGGEERAWRWSEVVPAAAAGIVAVVALAWGAGALRWLSVQGLYLDADGSLRPWLIPTVALSALAVVLVAGGRRWSARTRTRAVSAFVLVDIVAFLVTSVVAVGLAIGPGTSAAPAVTPAPSSSPGSAASPTVPVSRLGITGRFAVYDPDLVDLAGLSALGVPDENLLAATYSVQGYGSIVDGTYAAATGTHTATGEGQDVLSTTAVGNGDLDQLDTTALLTPAVSLVGRAGTPLTPGAAATGRRTLHPGSRGTWFLGGVERLSGVRLTCSSGGNGQLTVGVTTSTGAVIWANGRSPIPCTRAVRVPLSGAEGAVALVVRDDAGAVALGPPELTTVAGTPLVADGPLQAALVPPRWRYAGNDGAFAIFRDTMARPPLVLAALPGKSLAGARVTAIGRPSPSPSAATVASPRGVVVVRAVAAISGWSARWEPARGGRPATLAVRRAGLVQAVTVPPGRGTLRWIYTPPDWPTGELLALLAALALAAAVVAVVIRRMVRAWARSS
jgi:hypothetical protein